MDTDTDFLYRVYASSRADEMRTVPWSDAEKEEFLRMQFRAQHSHYHQVFPTARYDVIECDGKPIGRLYVDRDAAEIRIIDIALLAEHRQAGIGGALMGDLTAEADRAELPITIHVECNNPALHLYLRLGFREVEDEGVYLFMRREPNPV